MNSTVALSLALSACSLAPNYERPQMALPTGWSSVAGVGATQQNTTSFWQEFGSAELNHLIDNALAQNLDLEAALHRIEQARAQAKSRRRAALSDHHCQRLSLAHLPRFRTTPIRRAAAAASATKSICGEKIAMRQSPPTIGSTRASSIARRCAWSSPRTRRISIRRF